MTFDLELPRELDSAAAARHAVDQLSDRLPEEQLGDVRLLVSELVTNSLRHSDLGDDDHIRLAVEVDDARVRVEVSDPGPGFPEGTQTETRDPSEGWGLYLVSTLSDRWGVESGDHTCVWFELDRSGELGAEAA